jgi:serine/threonine protein phosphatase PrpC
MPTLDAWGATDLGLTRRNNEDAWCIDTALRVAIVADGMGGASSDEVASALTVEVVLEHLRKPEFWDAPAQAIEAAIQEANRRVLDKSRNEESCSGMGSTIVVACWDLPRLFVANVGDSRAYLWRRGELTQLSYDQTLVNELRVRYGLSEEEVRGFPHKSVLTMAVGTSAELLIRSHEVALEPGDQVLLCSDGLSGPVGDPEIAATLGRDAPLQEKGQRLIEQANAAGGPDNVTAVVLRYLAGTESGDS